MNNGNRDEQKIPPFTKEQACFAVHLINKYELHQKLPLSRICIILAENSSQDQVPLLIGLKSVLFEKNQKLAREI